MIALLELKTLLAPVIGEVEKAPEPEPLPEPDDDVRPERFTWEDGDIIELPDDDELVEEKHGSHNQASHGRRGGRGGGGGSRPIAVTIVQDPHAMTSVGELSEAERAAMKNYVENSAQVSLLLREGRGAPVATIAPPKDADIKDLDSAIAKSTVKETTYVYRGVNSVPKSDVFEDNGFASTSLDPHVAHSFGYRLYQIEIPKGSNALAVNQGGGKWSKEAELLLPRGARFRKVGEGKINYIDRNGPTQTDVIHLRYEGANPKPYTLVRRPAVGFKADLGDLETLRPFLLFALKHGSHNQASHGRRGGRGGGGGGSAPELSPHEWAAQWSSEWKNDPAAAKERKVMLDYAATGYREWNGALRTDTKLDRAETANVKALDQVIAGQRIDRPVSVYRGWGSKDLPDDWAGTVGSEFRDPGFLSTSLDKSVAEKFASWAADDGARTVVAEVRLKTGTKALYGEAAKFKPPSTGEVLEHEILLGRKVPLRVVEATIDADGQRRWVLEIADD